MPLVHQSPFSCTNLPHLRVWYTKTPSPVPNLWSDAVGTPGGSLRYQTTNVIYQLIRIGQTRNKATRNKAPVLMAIHPGEHIEREMQASHLSKIVKGNRFITKPVADKLEVVFGIPSIDWVSLQTRFDYDTQKNEGEQIAELVCFLNLTTSSKSGNMTERRS